MDELFTIATYYSMSEAEPVRLAMEAAGIPTVATDESMGSLLTPTMIGGIKLQVAAADAARAEEVLATLDAEANPTGTATGEDDDGVSFNCPECKAEIWYPSDRRGHVEICPECGAHVDVPGGIANAE